MRTESRFKVLSIHLKVQSKPLYNKRLNRLLFHVWYLPVSKSWMLTGAISAQSSRYHSPSWVLTPHSSLWPWQHQVVPLTDRPRLTSSTSLNLFTWPPPAPAPVAVWPQNLGPRAGLWPESERGVETEGCESLTPHWATGGFTYNLSTFVNYGYTKILVYFMTCVWQYSRERNHTFYSASVSSP